MSPLKGFGDVGQDRPYTTPVAQEIVPGPIRVTAAPAPRPVDPSQTKGLTPRWVMNMPWKRIVWRTITGIAAAPAAPVRLETGLGGRAVVMIHVIGDNGIWLGFGQGADQRVAVNNGEFVPGSPVAGAHMGGTWAMGLEQTVYVFGIADGAPTDVTIIEAGF